MGDSRYFYTSAIILKLEIFQEINKKIIFFSSDMGLLTAIAYGAAKVKSRFCSIVRPFREVDIKLYKTFKSTFYKLEDVKIINECTNITGDLSLIYSASFFAEVISKSYISAEEYKNYFYLIKYSLELLESQQSLKSMLFFCSKFLFLCGYSYNFNFCNICKSKEEKYSFEPERGGVYCKTHSKKSDYIITNDELSIMKYFFSSKYIDICEYELNNLESCRKIKVILLGLIQKLFTIELKSLRFVM